MKAQDIRSSDERSGQALPRKPYQKPRVELYGDLAEIAKAVVGVMLPDGSAHQNKHFTS